MIRIKVDLPLVKPNQMPFSVVQFKRLYGCKNELIATQPPGTSNRDVLAEMVAATEEAGFTVKERGLIRFGIGEGVTVGQFLAESLADMHTYPEHDDCAHVWLDYCNNECDNTAKGDKWWDLTLARLEPRLVFDYPTFYLPVRMSDWELQQFLRAA